jgi:Arc/MetJ-type ribon-helix-helix transcriptional regulator
MDKLSTDLERDIEARIKTGPYGSPDELLRIALQALDERTNLETLLLNALDSGEAVEVTSSFWEEKRRHLRERFAPKS